MLLQFSSLLFLDSFTTIVFDIDLFIQCPGRLLATCGDGSIIQEYIVFDANQALPLDLIEFTVATAANAGQVTEVIANPINNGEQGDTSQ